MFRNLFRPDSALMITMSQITDCIFLSLFWLLGCFPIATTGASFAALYDSVYRTYRKGEKHSWQRFFHVFRTNWRSGIMPTVVVIALFALLWPMARRNLKRKIVATNTDALVGRICFVTEDIVNAVDGGRVKVGDVTWSARSENGAAIAAGKQVKILKIQGVKVYVEEAKKQEEVTV